MTPRPPDPDRDIGPENPRPCGDCDLCCRLLEVKALGKAAGERCRHLVAGVGCSIHASRPEQCSSFQCQWTVSPLLGDEWRPDRANFLIWAQAEGQIIVEVDPDHPDAWRAAPYYNNLRNWSAPPVNLQVLVRAADQVFMVFPEADVAMGPLQPDKPMTWGYQLRYDGKRVPYAYFGEPPAATDAG